MALAPIRLPRLPRSVQFIDNKTGFPTQAGQLWWQRAMEQIEAGVNGVIEAQAAADAAETAAVAAQAAADTAQTAADNAQAAVDAIVVPPSGSLSVSTNTGLGPDDVAVLVDATGGAVTITLSNASAFSGSSVLITKTDATANPVNVVPGGSDTLNGGPGPAALSLAIPQKSFVSDALSAWFG